MMILYACDYAHALVSLGTATEIAVRLFGNSHVFNGLIVPVDCVSAPRYRTTCNVESGWP